VSIIGSQCHTVRIVINVVKHFFNLPNYFKSQHILLQSLRIRINLNVGKTNDSSKDNEEESQSNDDLAIRPLFIDFNCGLQLLPTQECLFTLNYWLWICLLILKSH
jgi:hypothetical protein